MKIFFKQSFIVLSILCLFAISCTEDSHDHDHEDDHVGEKEFRYIRLLVSDENSTQLSMVTPYNQEITTFESTYPKSAIYATESNRYAAVIHRENNLVQTFDTGLEFHGDHVDVRGTPKFGALIGEGSQPTHFKSKKGELLTFNDGDGTLSIAKESDIHTLGAKMLTISTGLEKHHGAMAHFENGTYAITVKDFTAESTLPEKVKIIDHTGNTIHEPKISTRGIHGNATDGNDAVFGSFDGILVVKSDGTQKLITYPEGFGEVWIGTILETNQKGKFIGYTRSKGAYLIDLGAESITPIFESTEIIQCKVSFDLNKLGVLLRSGELHVYDLQTLAQEKRFSTINAVSEDAERTPQMNLTRYYAYITEPESGHLLQFSLEEEQLEKEFELGGIPYRFQVLGYETNESH